MATQLKNTLAVVALAPGASVVLPHNLNRGSTPVAPDIIFIPSPDLEVTTSDDVAVTVRNDGAVALTGTVLVEAWHTIERFFGDVAAQNLPVKPVIVVGAEPAGSPPQPPFQLFTRTIYASLTGSDVTGNGTLLSPYRTFQRAVRDVPLVIPAGSRYIVDITGIGIEVLPADYAMPTIKSSKNGLASNFTQGTHFPWQTALDIVATPQPASTVPLADTTIAAGVVATDATTGLKSVTDVTKVWPVNALKGKFLFSAGGATGSGVIVSNTVDTVVVTTDVSPTFPATIVEPSAILAGTLGTVGASLQAPNMCPMSWNGIKFTKNGNLLAFWQTGEGQSALAFCDIESGSMDVNAPGVNAWWSYIHGGVWNFFSGAHSAQYSYFDAIAFSFGAMVNQNWLRACVLTLCNSIASQGPPDSPNAALASLLIRRTRITGSTADAVRFTGGNGRITQTIIETTTGAAIKSGGTGASGRTFFSQGMMALNLVRGTGNTSFGLDIDNGVQVRVQDAVTDVGEDSGGMKVGTLAARTWADFRVPAGGLPIQSQIDYTYDPTLGASAQLIGSGSGVRQP
jgi:hypothetical protein